MKRLYLVDAHAFLHRAYHALPPLTNSKGEPVGALFGFARMLLMLVRKEKPEAVAVCFDTPEKTFRHDANKDYKATRKEIDQDLISQLGRAREMTEAMGYTCVELPGYEADDVMATLARRCGKAGFDAVLVTGDKDALQMVGPGIRVFNVAKNVWMDPPQVEEKLGVRPDQIIDYLSLIGDSTDNVSGVKGIGPVTAVALLKKFGTLEGILKAAKADDPAIKPGIKKALVAGQEDAVSSRSLIKLADDAPIDCKVLDCGLPEADPAKVRKVLGEKLGLNQIVKELTGEAPIPAASAAPAPPSSSNTAVLERTEAKVELKKQTLKELLGALAKAKALTVAVVPAPAEGDLLNQSPVHVAVGLPDGRVAFAGENEASQLKALLSGKALKSVYHVKESRRLLESIGLELSAPVFDTMLAAALLDPAQRAQAPQGETWEEGLQDRAAKALGHEALRSRLEKEKLLDVYEDVILPLSEVLRRMEDEGVALDSAYLKKLSVEFEKDIAALRKNLDELAGFPLNPNSPKQLGELLFDKLQLPVIHKTAKGGRSTDEEVLRALAPMNPIPAKVLEFRELAKLKSTYIDGLLGCMRPTCRVHTTYDQTGSVTGRLSSNDPNLQNIPIRSAAGQRIRRAFVAKAGHVLLSADYSQIDLRVLAHVSGDEALCDAFQHDGDIHTRTASEMFHVPADKVDPDMRRKAKAINFGIVYGQSAFGLANLLGIPQREAADYIKAYFARYKGVQIWIDKNLELAKKTGLVRTLAGRIRLMPELAVKNTAVRQFGERAARNTPIQGGAADVINAAMLRVAEGLAGGSQGKSLMLLQIHDELLFEVPKGEVKTFAPWLKKTMEGAMKLRVPLIVGVKTGDNWQDMKAL